MGKPSLPQQPDRPARHLRCLATEARTTTRLVIAFVCWHVLAALPSPILASPPPEPDSTRAGAPNALTLPETELHLISPATASLQLAHPYVEPGSVSVWVEGVRWEAGRDFRVLYQPGIWVAQRPLGGAERAPQLVRISYRFHPVAVPPERDLHPVATAPGPGALVGPPSSPATLSGAAPALDFDPGQLTVRGSKSVRMSSGSRRDLAVDQNLRLTIDGRLTPEITVRASLSDDNLPVVPEGNTEELRDIDKVLIELEARRWRATLGDFVARRTGTVYGDYRRKLQGASLTVNHPAASVEALAGAPRGVYRTMQLRGQEGNQGPYELGAGDVGGSLFMVAGSEKVLLDGMPLVRGADHDYVIDYVRGTITFTYRRLITAESTLVVEFEEGEGAYSRTVLGAGGEVPFRLWRGDALAGAATVRLTRERDDPQRPRSGELSAEDQAALSTAGDDATAAIAGGVTTREPGPGAYRAEELGGRTIYVYDPQSGTFDVAFFYTGTTAGDYGIDSLTVAGVRAFGYRGEGQGSYRVGRPLPLPSGHSLATLSTRLGEALQPRLRVEWNASQRDLNLLSARDDSDNRGVAWVAHGTTGAGEPRWRGRGLGRFSLEAHHENRDSRFRPFLLRKDLFAYDRWGLGGRARRGGFLDQREAETQLSGRWEAGAESRAWRMAAEWARLEHGGDLTAARVRAENAWRLGAWDGTSVWEQARSEDAIDPLSIQRRRESHEIGWTTSFVRPSARLEHEQWEDAAAGSAGAAAAGARLRRWGTGLAAAPGRALRWDIAWERGLADSLRASDWRRERDGRTARAALAVPPWRGVRLTADGTWRQVTGPGQQVQTTRLGKLNVAGAWPQAGSDWSLIYGLDKSRAVVLDRQIIFVGQNQGDYDQAGQFVGRDQGDFNVVYAATDSLVAATEVTGDLTWRQDFVFFPWLARWGRVSTLTHLAARGRSRAEDVGPLLRFAPSSLFDPEQTVLGEFNWQQELNLTRERGGLDLRLRLDLAQTRDRQFFAHPEDRLRRAYQATLTHNLDERSSLQLKSAVQAERRDTAEEGFSSQRGYDASTWRHEAEWSLRPGGGDRLAVAGELIRRRDTVSGVSQHEWAVRPSARVRLERRLSAVAELRWAEVASDGPDGALRPFFFSYPGGNREANVRATWDPSQQLSVSLVYFGRRLGERGWQHDVRLESTARF